MLFAKDKGRVDPDTGEQAIRLLSDLGSFGVEQTVAEAPEGVVGRGVKPPSP